MKSRQQLEQWHRDLVANGPKGLAGFLVYAVLVCLSLVYGCLLWLRERAYLSGLKKSCRPPVPVVSVGNLTVGGTGKTPLTDLLVKRLLALGSTPAVVSRGYGRKVSAPVEVVSMGEGPLLSPDAAGDEPYLLAQRNPQAIVIVAARRSAGVEKALDLGADILVLDDGFQHLAVQRDVNICLLDAQRPLANGLPLPAGLLREFPSALNRASLFLLSRCESASWPESLRGRPLVATRHRLADTGWDLVGNHWRISDLAGKKIGAFCGIASPDGFFSALQAMGVEVRQTLAFPDHVCYDHAPKQQLLELSSGLDLLLTTEKDAVKLLDTELPCPCVAIPLELDVVAHGKQLDTALRQCLRVKDERTMSPSKELIDILACPACKGAVTFQVDTQEIICPACKLAYPVRDGIPVMLIDEAKKLES